MFDLIPYGSEGRDIFSIFDELEKRMFAGSSFPGFTVGGSFRTDITDEGDKYVLEAELPGFDKKDISIDITEQYLTISAKREHEEQKEDKKGRVISRERSSGSFVRRFGLSGVESEGISASYKNGILTLELPKKQASVPTSRKLEIKD